MDGVEDGLDRYSSLQPRYRLSPPGLHFKDTISKLLVQSTLVAQHACYGDGGLLSAMLASKLVLGALDMAGSHAARLQVISAYQRVFEWVSELTDNATACSSPSSPSVLPVHRPHGGRSEVPCPGCSVVLSLRDAGVQAYVAVVRNVVASKQVRYGIN